MLSKPNWSKLDAIIIGVLLLAGTSALVEAGNRVVIDPPEAVGAVDETAKYCMMTSQTGDVMPVRYAAELYVARNVPWCQPAD